MLRIRYLGKTSRRVQKKLLKEDGYTKHASKDLPRHILCNIQRFQYSYAVSHRLNIIMVEKICHNSTIILQGCCITYYVILIYVVKWCWNIGILSLNTSLLILLKTECSVGVTYKNKPQHGSTPNKIIGFYAKKTIGVAPNKVIRFKPKRVGIVTERKNRIPANIQNRHRAKE